MPASALPRHTDFAGHPVAWRQQGDGSPVLFLHGLGGTRSAWGPQLRGLSNRFRCLAWDMPGYGDSAPLVPLNYEGIADSLVELLDRLQIETVDLVGLSFGGMHALHTALRHPDRIGRMVLAGTSPAFGMDGTKPEDWIRSRLAPIDQGQTPTEAASQVIDAITAVTLSGPVRQEILASFGEIPAAGFRAAVHCLPSNDIRHRLSEIQQEACVIVGELDEETPVAYAKTLADGLVNSEIHILNGIGHLTPSEDPERFNAIVADFLLRPSQR